MRVWYYPVAVGVLVSVGLLSLFAGRTSDPDPEREVRETPDRFVKMLEPGPPSEPNPDAGEGARARREVGRVGKADATLRPAPDNPVEVKRQERDRQVAQDGGVLGLLESGDPRGVFGVADMNAQLSGGVGGLVGAMGAQTSGSLGTRGSGRGGGGYAEGLGGLGTKGVGVGRSGYGVGGGHFGAFDGAVRTTSNLRGALSKDWQHVGHNPTELVEEDMLSTFSIDVDTASYTQARRQIRSNQVPAAASVRTEEFVNFFRYDYPEPEAGRPLCVTMDGASHPWRGGHHLLRVGIRGARHHERARRPVHLTFLVDVSGSMRAADKLPLAKRSLQHLLDHLEEGDTVAIATYAGGSRVVLKPTDASQHAVIRDAIDGLQHGGGTAMASGMKLAYDMALRTRVDGEESRVIVLSDGDANIGPASHETILSHIAQYAKRGVTLSTIGFGTGNYRDTLMEQLADKGDGNYAYVDGFQEAKRVFGEDMGATMRTIARDVKIQVAFNGEAVIAYKLIGYENREIRDEDFRNDKVDAGEIGAGHTVTALYDVVLRDAPRGALATVRVRHKDPGPDSPAAQSAVELPARAVQAPFEAGSRDLRRAFAAASFAEKLRGAKEMEEVAYGDIAAVIRQARRPGDERDEELLSLVEQMDRWRLRGTASNSLSR